MPIYQYKCTDCGHQLEALQKMSDSPLSVCPACQAPALRKQLTAAAFKLKGTGWYETDFKNSGTKPQSKSGADSSNGAAASNESGAASSDKTSRAKPVSGTDASSTSTSESSSSTG